MKNADLPNEVSGITSEKLPLTMSSDLNYLLNSPISHAHEPTGSVLSCLFVQNNYPLTMSPEPIAMLSFERGGFDEIESFAQDDSFLPFVNRFQSNIFLDPEPLPKPEPKARYSKPKPKKKAAKTLPLTPREPALLNQSKANSVDSSEGSLKDIQGFEDFDSNYETLSFDENESIHSMCFMQTPPNFIPGKIFSLKSLIAADQRLSKVKIELEKKKYNCRHCGAVFTTGCAMGGHISKTHRGCSKSFKVKKIRSSMRKVERNRAQFLRTVKQTSPQISEI